MCSSRNAKRLDARVLPMLMSVFVFLGAMTVGAFAQEGKRPYGAAAAEPVAPTNSPSIFTRVIGTDVWRSNVGGLRNVGSGTIGIGGLSGTVTRAYIFWHGVSSYSDPAINTNIRINGFNINGTPTGTSYSNNWTGYYFSHSYRADITNLVAFNPNRSYSLSNFGSGTLNPNGAAIIVFYNNSDSADDYDVTVLVGNDSNGASDYDPSGWDANFGLLYDYGVPGDSFDLFVADGQAPYDPPLFLNGFVLRNAGPLYQGNTVPSTNNGPVNDGNLWDMVEYDFDPYVFANSYNNIRLTSSATVVPDYPDYTSLVVAIAYMPIGQQRVSITNQRVGGDLNNTTQNALLGADVRLQANLYPSGLTGGNFSWTITGPYQIVSGSTNTDVLNVRWTEPGTYNARVNYVRNGVTLTASVNVNVIVPTLSSYTANMVDFDQITRNQGCNGITFGGGAVYSLGCFRANPDGTYNLNNGIVFTATAQIPAVAYLSDPAQSGIKYKQYSSELRKRIQTVTATGQYASGQLECMTRRTTEGDVNSGWQVDGNEAYGHPFIRPVPRFSQGNTLTYSTFDAPAQGLDSETSLTQLKPMVDVFSADIPFEMYVEYFVGADPNAPTFKRPLRLASDNSALYHRIVWRWGGQAYFDSNSPTRYILQFSTTTPQGTFLTATGTNAVVPFQGNQAENIWKPCPGGPPPSGNRIDASRFFVRQQYLDILHREPDAGGWDAWTSVVTRCAFDNTCRYNMRIVTARGFLESPENISGNPKLANYGSDEYNREYVRLCYVAFLNRQPGNGEDQGWVNYINSHPGDYNTLVGGFINSIEYRSRFGPA